MHNIISRNILSEWGRLEKSVESLEGTETQMEKINDYFECIIECEDGASACKRICKEILV